METENRTKELTISSQKLTELDHFCNDHKLTAKINLKDKRFKALDKIRDKGSHIIQLSDGKNHLTRVFHVILVKANNNSLDKNNFLQEDIGEQNLELYWKKNNEEKCMVKLEVSEGLFGGSPEEGTITSPL